MDDWPNETSATVRPPEVNFWDTKYFAWNCSATLLWMLCCCLCLLATRFCRFCQNTNLLARCVFFVILNLLDQSTKAALVFVVWRGGHWYLLFILISAYCFVSFSCVLGAFSYSDSQKSKCNTCVYFPFTFVFMGLLQGIHVQLVLDDYEIQREQQNEGGDGELPVPTMTPARFQYRGVDGVFEGSVSAMVALFLLLRVPRVSLSESEIIVFELSAIIALLTAGLSVMEVDYRTSASVQHRLKSSAFALVLHALFRISDVWSRLLTIVISAVILWDSGLWWAIAVAGLIDILFGIILLVRLGGRDPIWHAVWMVGVVFFFVNIMQFVDAPGLSLQAKRISRIIAPLRMMVSAGIGVFLSVSHAGLINTDEVPSVFLVWSFSTGSYLILLRMYAVKLKPVADVGMAVSDGDTETLHRLLRSGELVLDVNRCGSDGFAPVHIAAVMGRLDCLQLLLEEKADVQARTEDASRDTALHLAADRNQVAIVRFLCGEDDSGATLNLQNAYGDTALHVAARKHNVEIIRELLRVFAVDTSITNKMGKTPLQCAPTEEFRFAQGSGECLCIELLERAEAAAMVAVEEGAVERKSTPASLDSAFVVSEVSVPLISLNQNEERTILAIESTVKSSATMSPVGSVATNCGISSFLLSAGTGAVGRSVMTYISAYASLGGETSTPSVTFDDFTEIETLGSGAYGKVHLVRQKSSGEMYALKIMDKAKFRSQKITSKAFAEQFILKTIRHPFIVSLHYAFQGSSFWALVMEYCPNGDLQDILGKYGTPGLRPNDAGRFGGEVLLALNHLHNRNVIFRDLKLENVIVSAEFHAKLTDFGFAKQLYKTNGAMTRCGSHGYVAPELMANTGEYTLAVDLYSFGVLMFMLLSGGDPSQKHPGKRRPPATHPQLRRRLSDIEQHTPRPDWASEALGGLELILILTADDPKKRTTCNEIKAHHFLQAILGKPVDCLILEAEVAETMAPTLTSSTASSFSKWR
eukprot:TRINITY_DN12612_c0_g2_i1.p1 TRINITY_DN12612_c0_g2~~TRINITY_DN12612_c0_g2_i1.p1  ORF type:complete len:1006 (-),score=121.48 TRINITY_DN12612_c0_g2_i1:27-2975(-)